MNPLEYLDVLFDESDTRDVVRQLCVRAWESGWQAGYESPDLPSEPGERANASWMNPYRIEGVDK